MEWLENKKVRFLIGVNLTLFAAVGVMALLLVQPAEGSGPFPASQVGRVVVLELLAPPTRPLSRPPTLQPTDMPLPSTITPTSQPSTATPIWTAIPPTVTPMLATDTPAPLPSPATSTRTPVLPTATLMPTPVPRTPATAPHTPTRMAPNNPTHVPTASASQPALVVPTSMPPPMLPVTGDASPADHPHWIWMALLGAVLFLGGFQLKRRTAR